MAGGFAALVAGIVILWPTPNGTVRIESDDPGVEIVFDKTGPSVKGAGQEPIKLSPGEHGVHVKRGDFEFDTDKLVLKKGETIILKVELLQGTVQVSADGKILGQGKLPAMVADTTRKPEPEPEKESPPPPVVYDADRKAAERMLAVGGGIRIEIDGRTRDIDRVSRLPRLPFKISHVNLYGNDKVRDADLACFDGCTNLKVLNLQGTEVSDAGLVHFKGCKSLVTFCLMGDRITDTGLANFGDCTGLTELNLHMMPAVTGRGLAYFKRCKDLQMLGLYGTPVGDAGLADFECKSIKVLNLMGTGVSDTGLVCFNGCKNLTNLYLSGAKITDAGLANFKDSSGLTELNFHTMTGVTDRGVAQFKRCKALRVLHLYGTPVYDAGLAGFPDCKELRQLALGATFVTDKGLAYFKDCKDLRELQLSHTSVGDAGLANIKNCALLTKLELGGTRVTDAGLDQLHGLRGLRELYLRNSRVTSAGVARFLQAVPECVIRTGPTAVGSAAAPPGPVNDKWVRDVSALPAPQQVAAVQAKLAELNPGFAGTQLKPKIENGVVVEVAFRTDPVTDIAPLRALPGVQRLNLVADSKENAKLVDLSPLQGMKLTHLDLARCARVRDLSPLRGMPLILLSLYGCSGVRSLAPLEGMRLRHLDLAWCQLNEKELAVLKGMPLALLSLNDFERVTDFTFLQGMPLNELSFWNVHQVGNLAPLQRLPLRRLWLDISGVEDLTQLQGMHLETIGISPNRIKRGMDTIRRMKTLKTIRVDKNDIPAAEFWKRYDVGEFKK
jgi:hypothetical protein